MNGVSGLRRGWLCGGAVVLGLSYSLAGVVCGQFRVTEFQASSSGVIVDVDGDASDWIEVSNESVEAASLLGWQLSDDAGELGKWVFPDVVLAAGDSLVVFASGKERAVPGGELHTNFKLASGGGYLGLVDPANGMASVFADYPRQPEGYSLGVVDGGGGEGGLVHFSPPTPGAPNVGEGIEGFLEPVVFGRAHGFHEAAFSLVLKGVGEGERIWYTLDGSDPGGGHGSEYDGPIEIVGTRVVRAVAEREGFLASPVVTQSYLDLGELVGQSAGGRAPAGWPSSEVNGQQFYYQMHPELVRRLGEERVAEALRALPSLSLVTPLENLVDRRRGIYVNADRRGRSWERPASIELLEPGGGEGFQVGCGVRIRGGISRSGENPKHSFRLLFRSEYGAAKLRWPMFGDEGVDEFDNLDLRTSTNWNWGWFGNFRSGAEQNTLLRDILARDVQGATGQAYTRSRYYHLYLNGVYWGIYMTQERSEASYAESYFGGDAGDYDVVKINRGPGAHTEATDGDLGAWRALWEEARRHRSNPELASYLKMQGLGADGVRDESLPVLLDVDALIDYLLVIYWTANNDAPVSQWGDNDWSNNWYGIRDRSGAGGGFRFLVHDAENTFGIRGYDLSFSRVITTLDRTGPFLGPDYRQGTFDVYNPQFLHQDLSGNPEYRLRFADRVQRYCSDGGVLTDEVVAGMAAARKGQLAAAMAANAARWGYRFAAQGFRYDESAWDEAAGVVEDFVSGRTAVLLGQLAADGLAGDVGVPVFSQRGGSVASGVEVTVGVGELAGFDSGEVYYTTDGSDPRRPGGAVAGSAAVFDGGGLRLEESLRVMARVRATREGEVVWSALEEVEFLVDAVPADAGKLVISEIHYHPKAASEAEEAAGFGRGAKFEFVELHNPGSVAISLGGVRVGDGIGFDFGSDRAAEIPAGGYGVIVNDENAFRMRYGEGVLVLGEYSGDLGNGGERVVVLGRKGVVLDEVDYGDGDDGWPRQADGEGGSLVLLVAGSGEISVGADGWGASVEDGGTPGRMDERWRDRDGDGDDDRDEWIAGTDPNDAGDLFRVKAVERSPGQVELRWSAVDGRRYRVEYAVGSGSGLDWMSASDELVAEGDGEMVFLEGDEGRSNGAGGLYRVVVER